MNNAKVMRSPTAMWSPTPILRLINNAKVMRSPTAMWSPTPILRLINNAKVLRSPAPMPSFASMRRGGGREMTISRPTLIRPPNRWVLVAGAPHRRRRELRKRFFFQADGCQLWFQQLFQSSLLVHSLRSFARPLPCNRNGSLTRSARSLAFPTAVGITSQQHPGGCLAHSLRLFARAPAAFGRSRHTPPFSSCG
jgi:hypothetical protein